MSLALHTLPTPLPDPLYLTARYEQLSHIHPKVGASGAAAANAFLFTHNNKRYVITSAHTLFSEPMAPSKTSENLNGATPPTEVTVGRTTLGPMAYSRFFDVAIFLATGSDISGTPYTQTNPAAEDCVAHFIDIHHPGITFTHTANATDHINRRTKCGAFLYNLMNGSSGSALSKDGKLVGMVSGCDQKYDNLTIYVPASTIVSLLNKLPSTLSAAQDLDALHIFPNMLTAPIPAALKAKFPESNLSHLVLYAKDANTLPLTMIEANVANKALDSGNSSTSFQVKRIKAEYQRWFHFPREVVVFMNNSNDTSGEIPRQIDALTKAQWGNHWDQVVWDGMNVIHDGKQMSKAAFEQLDNHENLAVTVYPFSTMYREWYNPRFEASTSLTTAVFVNIGATRVHPDYRTYQATLTDGQYEESILYVLLRQWAFLVLSGLGAVADVGHQIKLFAKECNRLKGVLGAYYNVASYMNSVSPIVIVLNKLAEFQDVLAMSFFQVFVAIFNISYDKLELAKQVFPLSQFNRLQSDFEEWYDRGTGTINGNSLSNSTLVVNAGNSITIAPMSITETRQVQAIGYIPSSQTILQTIQVTLSADSNATIKTGDVYLNDNDNMRALLLTDNNLILTVNNVIGPTDGVWKLQLTSDDTILLGEGISIAITNILNNANAIDTRTVKTINSDGITLEADDDATITSGTVSILKNYPKSDLPIDKNGNCSYTINGLEVEHLDMVSTMAQALTAQRDPGASDTVGMELELVYLEFERLRKTTDFSQPYYPQSFEIVKSIWDHSHNTMANLLPELGKAFDAETTVTVELTDIPAALRAWPMLESKQRSGGGSHLCTKMRKHGVVSEEEFHTISTAITPYVFTHHRKELMVYFEFAPEVLQKLETQSYNWAGLRGFANSMLDKIASKDLESAFQEWMQTILKLKEEAGQPDSLKVLDVALATC